MFTIRKTILMLLLATMMIGPASAAAGPSGKQSPQEAEYFAKITGIITSNMEKALPKEEWPAERTRIVVLVQIRPDGTIGRSELGIKSEHEFMNQALMAALEKSQPLPAPPEEFQIESGLRLVGLVFDFDKNAPASPGQSPAPPQAEAASPPAKAPEAAQ